LQQLFVILFLTWQGPAVKPAVAAVPASSSAGAFDAPNLRCGAESLYFGLKWLDLPVANFAELEAKLGPPSGLGYSMAELESAAKSFGAQTLGVETTLENLARRPEPLVRIAHMNSKHFVTIVSVKDGMVDLINPPAREIQIPSSTFRQLWDGKVLLLSTSPIISEEELTWQFPWRLIVGVATGVLLTFLASFVVRFKKPHSST
jgi:ABC-type bacteriocin/lantibiotic exporter with double-glycine peptidase domain